MSDAEEIEIKPFAIERASSGRAKCKKCKEICPAKEFRLARLNPNNPFGSGPLKNWYHLDCYLIHLKKGKGYKAVEISDDLDGWNDLSNDDKKFIAQKIGSSFKVSSPSVPSSKQSASKSQNKPDSKDNRFCEFQRVTSNVANEASYNRKSAILQKFFKEGSNGKKFEGSLELWLQFLLPQAIKRVYNLQGKQIVKLFSRVFNLSHQEMLDDLAAGDISETIAKYFEKSKGVKPIDESFLTITEVDDFLEQLSGITQEDPQVQHIEKFCKKCTINDLRIIIRLILHDLKMNCGPRHVLDAVHENAYNTFQKSRSLQIVIKTYVDNAVVSGSSKGSKSKSSGLQLMTPVAPMLAEPCKDLDRAIKKCPIGFYSEIKYDGERVQIHKKGDEFKFFSRNLKPVMDHKIANLKEFVPKAFPNANDLILDSEILMVDTETGELLPFGTLGKHKKKEQESASTCLFIFDCLYFNGDDLTNKSMKERRSFLEENICVIKNHVQLSEYKLLKTKNELVDMTKSVLQKGLEGLVLKPLDSVYEPGKRRWLKVKKDYLMQGRIADTADLVILGAWFGTGKMGGIYSIYLMGCYDEKNKVWKTVTKVHSGLDDNQFDILHKEITSLMEKCDSHSKIPKWIKMNRAMIPNALAKDPFKMPVLEITGAEFTKSDTHTTISIRFPRITKIRRDKSPNEATNLEELAHLFEESKSGIKLDELNKLKSKDSPSKKVSDTKTSSKTTSTITSFLKKNDEKEKKAEKRKTNDDDNEPGTSTKKSKIANVEKKSDDTVMKRMDLFNEFILYCPSGQEKNEEIKEFQERGGTCTSDSTKANLVLHDAKAIDGNMEELREIYNPHCKHRQQSWIKESLEANELKNPLYYTVKLRQV